MNDLHAGDNVLNGVLKRFPGVYNGATRKTEELFNAYLKPRIKDLQPRKYESEKTYRLRLMAAFKGLKWRLAKHKIAAAFTDANTTANEYVNDSLESAFIDGMNESAYSMAMTGAEMWPVTMSVVLGLAAAKIISLNKRKLNRRRDIAYNEQRIQGTVHAVIFQGVDIEKLPHQAAMVMFNARRNEMISYARAAIYGASDSGAYFAGLEAEKEGIDIEKTWLSIMDMNVRPSHKNLHGVTIPLHEKFHGLHGLLMFPHDPDAPPAEIYRCRCRMAVHIAGKSPGEYSRKILPTQTTAYVKWRDEQIRKAGGELELLKLHKRMGR